ncbi:Isochorismatase-like protein, partial [Podospora conica]
RLGFGARPALLLLELTDVYLSPSSPLCLPPAAITSTTNAIATLLHEARNPSTPIPIFYSQTVYTAPSVRDAGLLGLKSPLQAQLAKQHTANTAAPGLQPHANDLILNKKHPSPFSGTNLASQLAALGIDTLIIGGFLTGGAVRATALDAMQAGFRPIVVAEACADLGAETHWANLMDVGAKYGDVVGVVDAVAEMR